MASALPFPLSISHDSVQDLRYAVRSAWRDRAFSSIAVLTLALGIGANTALFTIVDAVLREPLLFHDPQQLVRWTPATRLPPKERSPRLATSGRWGSM